MSKRTKILLSLLPVLFVFVLIFVFSSFDATDSSAQSSTIVKFIKKNIFPDLSKLKNKTDVRIVNDTIAFIIRKGAHMTVYMLLGFFSFASLWFIKNKKGRYFSAIAVSAIYAISDEIHQMYVPGRSCEFRDVCIDTCGAAFGAVICLVIVLLTELRRVRAELEQYKQGGQEEQRPQRPERRIRNP